ncbi:MAG: AI-2E family transporter [Nanoarchaeota archaeon]
MNKDINKNVGKYIFWAIIILLIIVSYFIIKPFLIAVISSFILAFLLRPVYNLLNKKLNKNFSALSCIVLIILAIIIPLAILSAGITQQAYSALNDSSLRDTLQKISDNPLLEKVNFDAESFRSKVLEFVISLITQAISFIPSLALSLLIAGVGVYYILIDWIPLSGRLESFIPLKNKKKTMLEINQATKDIVFGTLLIAIIEGVVAAIGFYLLGLDSYLILSAIIFLSAFIPGIGPFVVWAPVALYFFISGNYLPFTGTIILGLIISLGIDTLLRNKILSDRSNINPLVMLIGILGGSALFGIFGFIIGPLILLYTIRLLREAVNN